MVEFKIGDKIKSNKWELEGDIFTIDTLLPEGAVTATCDATLGDDFPWFFHEGQYVALVQEPKFKVGDKVKANRACIVCSDFVCVTGTVLEVFGKGEEISYNVDYGQHVQRVYEELDEMELVEESYYTPEGALVYIGDKGAWHGIEYTLVEGPDHHGKDQPYWKNNTIWGWLCKISRVTTHK